MTVSSHVMASSAVIQNLKTPVLLMDADLQVIAVNKAFAHCAGVDVKQAAEADLEAFFGPDAEGILRDSLQLSRMSSGDSPCRFVLQNNQVLHGSVTFLRNEAVPCYLLQGQQEREERYLKVNQELFRTQEALLRQRHVAERHEKAIAGLDEFLSVLMHDIRSPLCTVWTSLQLALEDLERKDHSGLEDMLDTGASSTKRLLDFVDRLYQNVRVGQTELSYEVLDVAMIAKELKLDLSSQFQASGAKLKIIGKIPEVNGDRQLVRQLLQNLMQNAMKFRSMNRRLVIELGAKHLPGGVYDLYLKDNGLGFPQEDAVRLFDRYHKNSKSKEAKEKNDGMGIGLATCKLIVEKHGWAIRADAKEGEGAVFTVRITT